MNLQKIWQRLIDFREERNWGEYHTDEALARSLMIEGAELNRLFQWGQSPDNETLADEVADNLIYSLYLCINRGFNPVEIIENKIAKNAEKYPIGEHGKWEQTT